MKLRRASRVSGKTAKQKISGCWSFATSKTWWFQSLKSSQFPVLQLWRWRKLRGGGSGGVLKIKDRLFLGFWCFNFKIPLEESYIPSCFILVLFLIGSKWSAPHLPCLMEERILPIKRKICIFYCEEAREYSLQCREKNQSKETDHAWSNTGIFS